MLIKGKIHPHWLPEELKYSNSYNNRNDRVLTYAAEENVRMSRVAHADIINNKVKGFSTSPLLSSSFHRS